MSLPSGTRLGAYDIVAPIGEGGMGEVYRARDTRLDRTVAVKVLLTGSAWSAEARARFEREARAISQLNHPHICTLFDVGREGDTEFIVLEYLDGETLASRLSRGAVPVADAVTIGIQIADALDAAHRRNIVHRDLKPGNVMLVRTSSAKSDALSAKLLDFGLAKPIAANAGTELATVTSPAPLTGQGTLLGTVPYMAPEQVEGEEADARSDLWALGCVLFEMLAGRRPFDGKTPASVAAAILGRDAPDVSGLVPLVPASLAHIVSRCLEKDRDARWQSASDVKRELQWTARQGFGAAAATTTTGTPSQAAGSRDWLRDWRSLVAVAFGLVAALIASLAYFAPRQTVPPEAVSLSITMPADLDEVRPPYGVNLSNVALSPDGTHVAFSGLRGMAPALFLRRIDTFDLREMPGGGQHPFFSADGRALAFIREGAVWRTPLETLAPVRVGALPMNVWNIRTALWHPRGDLLFGTDRGVFRMPASGGEAVLVVKADLAAAQEFRELSMLPDDRVLAGTADKTGGHLAVIAPTTWTVDTLEGQPAGRFVDGWLLIRSPSGVMARRFDVRSLTAVGEPVSLAGVTGGDANSVNVSAISPTGSVAWIVTPLVARDAVYVDRAGRETPLPFPPPRGSIRWPRVSPSGQRLAFGLTSFNLGEPLQVLHLGTGALTRLSQESATEPVWSLDESSIVSSAGLFPNHGLVRQPADGRAAIKLGAATDFEVFPTALSTNNDLLYYVGTRENVEDLYVLNLGTNKVTRIPHPGTQRGGRFSPDGRWIAYESDVTGVSSVEVVSWPDLAVRRVVGPGTEPMWSADQRELFFRNGDAVMAARVLPGRDFALAPAVELFSRRYEHDITGDQSWDLTRDGRFLMLKAATTPRLEVRVIRHAVAQLEAAARR